MDFQEQSRGRQTKLPVDPCDGLATTSRDERNPAPPTIALMVEMVSSKHVSECGNRVNGFCPALERMSNPYT